MLTVAAPLVLLSASGPAPDSASHASHLADVLREDRFTAGRFTGQERWQPCVSADTSALIPRVTCGDAVRPGSRPFRRITRALQKAQPELRSDSTPITLRASALLESRFGGTSPARLNEAAALLERARTLAPDNAKILNDLAVVYLEIGARDQALEPMLRALNAIERAAERDSSAATLFNRALILQRLYLIRSAERAWARYLATERDPRWRAEGEMHARWVAQVPDTMSWDSLLRSPPPRMDAATRAWIAARVRRSPQAARDSSWVLLGVWGKTVRHGEHRQADHLLSLVREIGSAATALGADRSVSLAVSAIDSASADPQRRAALATAHARLGEGFEQFYARDFEDAASTLARAERMLRSLGSPARKWAAFYRAAAEMELGRYETADRRFDAVRASATADEPGLAGKATWALGVSQVRRGYYEDASTFYRGAAPYITMAREPENEGTISYLLTESLALAGQVPSSRVEALHGLQRLSPYRRSNFLNNHLSTVAADARREGWSHAAFAIMEEVLAVSRSLGKADVLARTHRARARDLLALGRHPAVEVELGEALRWADSLGAGAAQNRVRADVQLVRGQVLRASDSRAALKLLSEVVEAYRNVKIDLHVPLALYEASLAAEAAGDPSGARQRLREAIVYLEEQQATFQSAEMRATFHETVENVFDSMIRLELQAERPNSAFGYLERARVAIQPMPGSNAGLLARGAPLELDRIVARLPRDMLLVDYALLEDRLVIWTASRRGWRHYSVPVARDTFAALAARFIREAEIAVPSAAQARTQLFDLLILPIAGELNGVRRLTVVPDRELYQVPFAALWDRRTTRYLVEDHQISTVPSATFYAVAAARRPAAAATTSALVVGDPVLDPRSAQNLPPLPGASREAREVARMYDRSRLITGKEAGRGLVVEQLPAYSIFHFAGHAVFNGNQPGSSYLALASDSTGSGGLLRAWEIGDLRLSNLQVVVLSACSTLNQRPTRAGAAAGLAYSFLRAGVPATVSTLWDVRDDTTTPLLVEFHRRLSGGASAAEALRMAQMQALRSGDPGRSAPLTWGAFMYTGP